MFWENTTLIVILPMLLTYFFRLSKENRKTAADAPQCRYNAGGTNHWFAVSVCC